MFSNILSFLSCLAFPKQLAKIERLEKDIGINAQTPELSSAPQALKTLVLPRIVVIGDEDAGKSSTLERVAHAEVFPRASNICTRQPIVLKLRHDPNAQSPIFKLDIPDFYTQGTDVLTAVEVQNRIFDRMKNIAENKLGVVTDKEIVVEITSTEVPTIDLVDLPGMIAVRVKVEGEIEATDKLSALTEACTRKYLDDERTGIVVCVIDSALGNLNTSKAIRMIQDSRPDIQKYTIGVLTKADKSGDVNWEEEGNSGPMWKLEARLAGNEQDVVKLQCGYVALKNRNTKAITTLPLPEHNRAEITWFETNIKDTSLVQDNKITDFGKLKLGLDALIKKIDMVICKHLNTVWVPGELDKYSKQTQEYQAKLEALGKSPSELSMTDLLSHGSKLLQSVLTPTWVDNICSQGIATIQLPDDVQTTTIFEGMLEQKKLHQIALEGIANGGMVENIRTTFVNQIKQCCESDNTGIYQLCRFPSVQDSLVSNVHTYFDAGMKEFNQQAPYGLQILEIFPSSEKRSTQIRNALIKCLMATLFIPLLNSSPSTKGMLPLLFDTLKSMPNVPEEKKEYSSDRLLYIRKLENIRHIEETLRTLAND